MFTRTRKDYYVEDFKKGDIFTAVLVETLRTYKWSWREFNIVQTDIKEQRFNVNSKKGLYWDMTDHCNTPVPFFLEYAANDALQRVYTKHLFQSWENR